jgi:hypothetical protein
MARLDQSVTRFSLGTLVLALALSAYLSSPPAVPLSPEASPSQEIQASPSPVLYIDRSGESDCPDGSTCLLFEVNKGGREIVIPDSAKISVLGVRLAYSQVDSSDGLKDLERMDALRTNIPG